MTYIDKIYTKDDKETPIMRKVNQLIDEVMKLKREIREMKSALSSKKGEGRI